MVSYFKQTEKEKAQNFWVLWKYAISSNENKLENLSHSLATFKNTWIPSVKAIEGKSSDLARYTIILQMKWRSVWLFNEIKFASSCNLTAGVHHLNLTLRLNQF